MNMEDDYAKHDPAQYESEQTANRKLDLKAYQWENRLLLFFAPTPEDETYQKQQGALEGHAKKMEDRDILTFTLFEDAPSYAGSVEVAKSEANLIRQDFQIKSGEFTLLLIGKDSQVKINSQNVVPANDIFALIDSMPMRQQEVVNRKHEG